MYNSYLLHNMESFPIKHFISHVHMFYVFQRTIFEMSRSCKKQNKKKILWFNWIDSTFCCLYFVDSLSLQFCKTMKIVWSFHQRKAFSTTSTILIPSVFNKDLALDRCSVNNKWMSLMPLSFPLLIRWNWGNTVKWVMLDFTDNVKVSIKLQI